MIPRKMLSQLRYEMGIFHRLNSLWGVAITTHLTCKPHLLCTRENVFDVGKKDLSSLQPAFSEALITYNLGIISEDSSYLCFV